jgi:hypothetical protein
MKLLLLFALGGGSAISGADASAFTGVWRAQIDSVPAVVMTFSDEGGELTGAILFYMIRRDTGQPVRSTPGHPEPLFNLNLDAKALDFKVSHRRSHGARTANDPPVPFRLKLTGPDEGLLIRDKDEQEALRVHRDK